MWGFSVFLFHVFLRYYVLHKVVSLTVEFFVEKALCDEFKTCGLI